MFIKSPGDVLDYEWDWSAWLGDDAIDVVAWTVPSGLTQPSAPTASNTATAATVWLASGQPGTSYTVTCQITTLAMRVAQYSQTIEVEDQ